MSTALDHFLDRLLMGRFGEQGHTLAHMYLQDRVASPLKDNKYLSFSRRGMARVFIPPREEDRVIMFSDNSGVYVREDGFCTPMGSDISHEVVQWREVER